MNTKRTTQVPSSPRIPRSPKTPRSSTSPRSPQLDRFIPQRPDLNLAHLKLFHDENSAASSTEVHYHQLLEKSLFSCKLKDHKILSFSEKPKQRILYTMPRAKKRTKDRIISQRPVQVLDAPGIKNDFYLNLMDWSCDNLLGCGLADAIYIKNMHNDRIVEFMQEKDVQITSVSFSQDGAYLAIADGKTNVQIWDVEVKKKLRTLSGHLDIVESMSWNNHLLSAGCKMGNILNHDVRVANSYVSSFEGHRDHVCGLKWNAFGTQLASGGNDDKLNIWSLHRQEPKYSFHAHKAAIKAIDWCPWRPTLLVSGGGTEDKCIRFWDLTHGQCENCIDTHSQVSAILWSKSSQELVSGHGFRVNQLSVWKYPSLEKIVALPGHDERVLHMAQSPDGCMIASLGADEKLRIWKVFEPSKARARKDCVLSMEALTIR